MSVYEQAKQALQDIVAPELKAIQITVPENLLHKIDKAAKKRGIPHSAFFVDSACKVAEN